MFARTYRVGISAGFSIPRGIGGGWLHLGLGNGLPAFLRKHHGHTDAGLGHVGANQTGPQCEQAPGLSIDHATSAKRSASSSSPSYSSSTASRSSTSVVGSRSSLASSCSRSRIPVNPCANFPERPTGSLTKLTKPPFVSFGSRSPGPFATFCRRSASRPAHVMRQPSKCRSWSACRPASFPRPARVRAQGERRLDGQPARLADIPAGHDDHRRPEGVGR